MNSRNVLFLGIPVLFLGGYAFLNRKPPETSEIEYRYATVAKGELMRSISATGQVVALTTVDVKSKAGGKVVKLAVDEGAVVHKGDLIATIDPADTQSIVDQASADLQSANARADQAEKNLELQIAQGRNDVEDARTALEAAKVRYRRAGIQSKRQPGLTKATIAQAQAAYDASVAEMERMQRVTIPQMRRDSQGNLSQATAQRDTAVSELKRQEELLDKGYVSGAAVDRARAAAEVAKTSYETAKQRASTLEDEVKANLEAQRRAVARARAALDETQINIADDDISRTNVAEAARNIRTAEVALQRAKDNLMQTEIRRTEVLAARASTVRNKVSLKNAQVQLDSTTVLAPRDGVVTQKYLEEGTIIPPGTSTFSQGTSLVQISDVTQLFVECAVDEAEVANVKIGQPVRITADAFRGQPMDGVVTRVNPAAKTENNVTAVKVRVKVLPGGKVRIVPGMNATCEFITLSKKDVLIVPSQALQDDGTVQLKGPDPKKPISKKVEVGETGNDSIEIKDGLKVGDEVVTAKIDLALLRDTQKKMQEAEQGGGLAGGGPMGGKKTPNRNAKKPGGK
ncbi:efflux RND transporter periplasmic adaptor subunit [Fimbriimonas ginsengisoli]|uniref:Efflux transporter, RND family, MFP subunit n=1 Tax=Fimbriimonas ginsengisoli Gsoil 348 TaxID=661478 RepID=A0A068NPA5_FIMGI|nr:efflux RND transporter periplasmic adaptor subunit [Fimbriimonas ginsengisoli]AIE85398.1 efflux transporter, RND family, MFP subunit [Fimbriimonas ginsengisoli Gsoil 348]